MTAIDERAAQLGAEKLGEPLGAEVALGSIRLRPYYNAVLVQIGNAGVYAWSEATVAEQFDPALGKPGAPQTVIDAYYPPHIAGIFGAGAPRGVILHGSRSGNASASLHQEFEGTVSWERNNPDGLGWNATIGEDEIALHMDVVEWGWNARAASDNYLAVEFAQPTSAFTITDAQVATFAWYFAVRVCAVYPGLRDAALADPVHTLPTHAEVERWGETGQVDGKTDCYAVGDGRADQLRARILALL